MFVVVLFIIAAAALLSWAWVKGISYMNENHTDYKGEDFLNWDSDVTKMAGRDHWDEWDENTVHTEGEI